MEEWGVFVVITMLVAFVGAIATPLLKLNTSITKLNVTIENLNSIVKDSKEKIDDHEKRITVMETELKGEGIHNGRNYN